MRKTIAIFSLLALAGSASLHAQDLRKYFVSMPDSVSPLVTKIDREDFLDYMDSNMRASLTNRMNSKTRMTVLRENLIVLEMSSESTLQIKALPGKKGQDVICMVSTMLTGAQDSHVRFYSSSWEPLEKDKWLPQLPSLGDFLEPVPEGASYQLRDAFQEADILFLRMDLDPDMDRMSLTCTTLDYVSKEASELLRPYLKGPVIYDWVPGKGFKRK